MHFTEIITADDAKEWAKEKRDEMKWAKEKRDMEFGRWIFYAVASLLVLAECSQL